jgi:ATP-dependent Clp protease ATP-binding subunit ClpA
VFSCGKVAAERRLPPERYGEAARLMRVGITDDPWSADALRDKIKSAETYLNARVLGQERAVAKTLDVLYRSAVGLNGAHLSSSPNRPRGVLFLAGPTGVGKTELAKGIAGLVLGADAEPLRFDMSEFRADEAHQRLIGAPPGYVGYDSGGELTNAVRANPVCVLLFDEIEKAHPRIFDLFLQILEDGRLTDGRGATVHFTESFLIFTSNLGVAEQKPGSDREAGAEAPPPLVNPSMDPREVERVLRRAYEDFFNRGIGRPELRNRFGDSYVVLDFIQKPTVEKIVDKALRTVAARLASVHQAELVVADQVCEELIRYACAKLADGGRGINNVVEAALVNPLSRHIFAHPPLPGAAVELVELRYDDDLGWQLEVR